MPDGKNRILISGMFFPHRLYFTGEMKSDSDYDLFRTHEGYSAVYNISKIIDPEYTNVFVTALNSN